MPICFGPWRFAWQACRGWCNVRVLLLHCAEVDGVAEHLWTGGCPPTVCLFRRGGCSFVRSLARSSSVFQTACRINLRTKHACPRVRTYGRRWQHDFFVPRSRSTCGSLEHVHAGAAERNAAHGSSTRSYQHPGALCTAPKCATKEAE